MKLAVLTLVSGEFQDSLFSVSGPMIDMYAKKIGADLVVDRNGGAPGYAKLKAIRELLKQYDRVLYIDPVILIRYDAPNLFDLVPDTQFGIVNESRVVERKSAKINWQSQIGRAAQEWIDDPDYYNSAVMVVSRCHAKIFADATTEIDNFLEQTLLNCRLFESKTPILKLPTAFNRTLEMIPATGRQVDDCYFSNFSGAFIEQATMEIGFAQFKAQAARFDTYSAVGVPFFPRRLFIETAGAVGDVVATEPVVRYIREVMHPNDDIVINTAWPEVFAHIEAPGNTKILPSGEKIEDIGYLKIILMPKLAGIPYNQFHPVDYASIMGLRGMLPTAHKRIKLKPAPVDIDVSDYVLVHPGRSWQSKTFPADWWNSVLTGLLAKGFKVAIIGKDVASDKGTVDVDASGCLDLRNALSLSELFGVVAQSPLLISNDSAPVHISGAFNNQTIVIPTCKHADYLVPFRAENPIHVLGTSLQKGPIIGEADDINMDVCVESDLLNALPPPSEVVLKAIQLLTKEA